MPNNADIPRFDDDKWPRDVRAALRWCMKRLQRPSEITYADVLAPTWDQSDNKQKISLPRGSGGSKFQGNWYPYPSPFTGTPPPPSDQGLRVRIAPGDVDGVVPSNMTDEWTLAANSTTFAWLDLELNDSGGYSSLTIETGFALPSPPAPPDPDSNGGFPTQMFIPIWVVATGDNNVLNTWPLEFFSLSIIRGISDWDGQKFTRRLTVTRDPISLLA